MASKTINQYEESVVASGFDAIADRYGEVAFLRRSAEALVEAVPQAATVAEVLDLATGPGTAALLLASRFPNAQITGIDVSADMVSTARSRAASAGLRRVKFTTASATMLPFASGQFDLVTCSNAIYYMPDFAQAIAEWSRVLRPQGTLAFSTFGAGVLEPMSSLFDARVRKYGVIVPQPTPLYRLTTTAACADLLRHGGLTGISVKELQLGYWIAGIDSWWQTLMSTGFRLLVGALDSNSRASFEQEHKNELKEHVDDHGLWLNVPVIVATGKTPER